MTSKLSFLLLSAFLLAACGDDHPAGGTDATKTPGPAGGVVKKDEPAGDAHGLSHANRVALGEIKVGDRTIGVFQITKVEPGKEGDFDLDFPAGQVLPGNVRGWIGNESGHGSVKVRFEKETDSRMHGHPEAPKPLPEGSALWVEIEAPSGVQKASIAFKN
jgi:hypothetical protein